MPASVGAFERRGAIGQIFIHPGKNVHEGICTLDLGRADTAESLGRKPAVPVVCINHADGAGAHRRRRSAARCARRCKTWLREGWMRCLLPVAEIRGAEDPDEFLLVHGHYDSWYEGIGDNATGDAALLELARVLWGLRGPSQADRCGSPGGPATRPADMPARRGTRTPSPTRLDEHCIAQLDIDSPGLRRRHGVRGSDVDGRGRRAVPLVDPGRARPRVDSESGRCAPATTRSTRSARPASTCCSRTSRSKNASAAATTRSAAAAATSPGTRPTI